MNVVFMGTPEFAVPCLEALVQGGYDVTGVVTQPDKPQGRKMKLTPPPVKEKALEYGIPVFQPQKMKEAGVLQQLSAWEPEVIIVVAYGKILPKEILELPKFGCINIHASLLPKYRGAGPIQWSVLNGEKETGVTSMYMEEGLDTGDMILKAATPIGENETASQLQIRLSKLGAQVLLDTLKLVEQGNVPREKQDDSLSCYAPMLDKSLSPLDFTKPGREIHHQICGLADWPCATAKLEGSTLKILRSEWVEQAPGQPGEITVQGKKLLVACGDGSGVHLCMVQPQGKKPMTDAAFLNGHPIAPGTKLE